VGKKAILIKWYCAPSTDCELQIFLNVISSKNNGSKSRKCHNKNRNLQAIFLTLSDKIFTKMAAPKIKYTPKKL
jgi:hypothetical protein